MKNITVSVDDEVYRRARIRAAEEGRSVSAVVRDHLRVYSADDSEFARLKREEKKLRAKLLAAGGIRAAERMPREEAHRRGGGQPRVGRTAE